MDAIPPTTPSPPTPPPLHGSGPKRKQTLAWWALLSLIPFILVQILYAWPQAKVRSGASDPPIPTFTAEAIALLFISLLFAWIAYRISRRSQFAASIVFCAMILFFTANVFYPVFTLQFFSRAELESRQAFPRQQTRPTEPPPTRFPELGFRIEPPPGWPPIYQQQNWLAAWASPDSRDDDLRAFVRIHCAEAPSETLPAGARGWAATWGGHVEEQRTFLDGEPALRIYAFAPQSGLKPVEGLICKHDGRFYMIIGGVTPGRSCHEQIEFLRKSWKWIPTSSPQP